jgi:hypothetical protein
MRHIHVDNCDLEDATEEGRSLLTTPAVSHSAELRSLWQSSFSLASSSPAHQSPSDLQPMSEAPRHPASPRLLSTGREESWWAVGRTDLVALTAINHFASARQPQSPSVAPSRNPTPASDTWAASTSLDDFLPATSIDDSLPPATPTDVRCFEDSATSSPVHSPMTNQRDLRQQLPANAFDDDWSDWSYWRRTDVHRTLTPSLMHVMGESEDTRTSAVERLKNELHAVGVSRPHSKAILKRAAERSGLASPRAIDETYETMSSVSVAKRLMGAGTAASRAAITSRRAAMLQSHLARKKTEMLGTLQTSRDPSPWSPLTPLAPQLDGRQGYQSLAFRQHAPSTSSFRPRPCAAYSFSFGPMPPPRTAPPWMNSVRTSDGDDAPVSVVRRRSKD